MSKRQWFQPTLPLRGATHRRRRPRRAAGRFNPRSPCGERPHRGVPAARGHLVSTHAPLAGSDAPSLADDGTSELVSTHAPLAGSD